MQRDETSNLRSAEDTGQGSGPRARVNRGPQSRRWTPSGELRRAPHDLERSRRHGTINRPGPLPFFGPVTQIEAVQFTEQNTPHRCVECGSRDHAGIDCPKYREGEGR